ncbi:hypothetical protein GCM10011512_29110 [Tersicoccus solisilvae]|uniref:Uncharacterized protein n=1 Tax=Tersicoccus solisilvae TaxID=1882339 RepID=A0ABQ1PP89_9MICC|nr:hypothetical protein [Tersicoccus solisilvae]GGD00405.1 hypothetical protein GCM10011512_29110 [Tersicoccus solisilvae]
MAPHLHLSGDTLEQVRETLHSRYGGAARLVSADKVRDGGLAGLLGRWHVEVVAELPDGVTVQDAGDTVAARDAGLDAGEEARRTAEHAAAAHALSGRSGLAALLAAADDEEELLQAATLTEPGAPRPVLAADTPATRGQDFAALLVRLGDAQPGAPGSAREPLPPGPPATDVPGPAVLRAAGDLVLVLGVGARALRTARTMAVVVGGQLHTAGACADAALPHVQSPRSAIAARAGAVRAGTSAVVGYGLGSPVSLGTRAEVTAQLSTAVGLGADQVWLVVDARHKPEDIDPWVRRISSRVPIDALAVIGADETGSPETIAELGLPVGWVDGGPASRSLR